MPLLAARSVEVANEYENRSHKCLVSSPPRLMSLSVGKRTLHGRTPQLLPNLQASAQQIYADRVRCYVLSIRHSINFCFSLLSTW
jgi:hypothetical protein